MNILIDRIQRKKMIVIGDLMLDRYYEGTISRISPEAPIPVLNHRTTRNILGGAGNVVSNLIAANQEVKVISSVGKDEAGDSICTLLEQIGVDTSAILRYSRRVTTLKSRYVSGSQQLLRVDEEQVRTIDQSEFDSIIRGLERELDDSQVIILSDYAKGILTTELCRRICELAEERHVKVIFDVKENIPFKYWNSYLVKPNKKELEMLYGKTIASKEELYSAMAAVKEKLQCRKLLVTLSADGMLLLDEKGEFHAVKAQTRKVYDVVGAGDTALAYLAVGIANAFSDKDLLELANAAASVKVTKFGTAPVGLAEVVSQWNKGQNSKLLSLQELQALLAQRAGQTVVFTNGCFDILHAGHVSYLRQARELGDLLIVGLNSDASVRRLKGNNRPINGQAERAEVLGGLEFVDYTVIFEEDTPLELIRAINPDILVKGSDYENKEVAGREWVESHGGQVILLDFMEGKSTTNIINRIKEHE